MRCQPATSISSHWAVRHFSLGEILPMFISHEIYRIFFLANAEKGLFLESLKVPGDVILTAVVSLAEVCEFNIRCP
jgi:hypothetical protein